MSNANGRQILEEAKAGIHGAVADALAVCLEVAVQERDKLLQQRDELLEVLKLLLEDADSTCETYDIAKAAITKAEATE